jgi:hypothetical protein
MEYQKAAATQEEWDALKRFCVLSGHGDPLSA